MEKWRPVCLYLPLECVVRCSKIIKLLIPDMPLSWAKHLLKCAAQEAEGCGTWCKDVWAPPGSSQCCHELAGQFKTELARAGTEGARAGAAHLHMLGELGQLCSQGCTELCVCTGAGGCSGALLTTEAGHAAVSESHFFTRILFLPSGLCLSTLRADSCWTGSCGEETGGKQKHFN